MEVQWSPIHAALGVGPRPLTFALIQEAIQAQVAETAALDWKRSLPDGGGLDEFAKDVAAMANSGGGYLVYGVTEARGIGTAARVSPVDVGEPAQRRLLAAAASRVHPFVSGVEVTPLPMDGEDQQGMLVVGVPASPEAPHIIGRDNTLGVPYRDSSNTRWMNERDLERAYAQRFRNRDSTSARLSHLQDEVFYQLDPAAGPWMVAVATPRVPIPTPKSLSADDARSILQTTIRLVPDIIGRGNGGSAILRSLGDAALNPRVGLRRWIARTRITGHPDEQSQSVHVEIHHDGSLTLAVSTAYWAQRLQVDDRHPIDVGVIELFAADTTALVVAAGLHFGVPGRTFVRLDLVWDDDLPLAAFDQIRMGGLSLNSLEQPSWSTSVRKFIPVLTEVPLHQDSVPESAALLAHDILNQFGIAALHTIREPSQ